MKNMDIFVATLNTGSSDYVGLGATADEARQAVFDLWSMSASEVFAVNLFDINTAAELDSHYGMRVFGPLFVGEAARS